MNLSRKKRSNFSIFLLMSREQISSQRIWLGSVLRRTGSYYHSQDIHHEKQGGVLEINIVMSISLFMLITYYSVMTDTNECDWHSLEYISPILIRISMTDIIRSVTPLWYHFIPFFGDHYNIIFYSYSWCHTLLSCTIYLQSSMITYHSDLILCYYSTIHMFSFALYW